MRAVRRSVVIRVVGIGALLVATFSVPLLGWPHVGDQNPSGAPRGGATSTAGQTNTPQTATGLIIGQVVDGATGQPISDAIVTVGVRLVALQQGAARGVAPTAPTGPAPPAQGVSAAPGARGAAGPTPAPLRLLTGSDGRFVLRDLPAGPVQLQATAPGYLAGNLGQSRPRGPARPLRLAAGERVTDVVVRLWRVGVITGSVVDEAGEPVIGVNVMAYRRAEAGAASSSFVVNGSARTDDRGVYRLATLAPGDYIVAVRQTHSTVPVALTDSMMQTFLGGAPAGAGSVLELMSSGGGIEALSGNGIRVGDLTYTSALPGPVPAPDRPVLAYQTVFHPGVAAGSQARAVTVQSGQERSGVDLPLQLVPAVRVSGLLTGPSGPVAATTVRLLPAAPDLVSGLDDAEVASAVTGPDGTFIMLGVTPGSYVARVERQSRASMASSNPLLQMFGGGAAGTPAPALYGQTALSVGPRDVSGVSIVAGEGARISGRVEFDGDNPPAAAQMLSWFVQITPVASNSPTVPPRTAIDERLQFTSTGYPGGRYWVSVLSQVPAGGTQWLPRSITASGRDVLGAPLDLSAGDVGDVVITLTNKLSQVRGTVRVGAGTVSRTATVVLIPAAYRAGRETAAARRPRQVQASELGVYAFDNLVPGEYLVAAIDDSDASDLGDEAYLAALVRVGTRVTLADLDRRMLDLAIVKVPR